ncbi:hypothetical protein AB0J63_26400 [Streptosporangium canum]|uniref:hypothetical protein n=1 Tax=Streptosporangium canum TaxID=324952 RepID=UPI0034185D0A
MTAALTVLLVLAALALFAVRPVDADARTPIEELLAARTPAELRATARRAGWPRVTARTLQVSTVVVLLLLVVACRMVVDFAYFAGTVIKAIAQGIAALGAGPELQGGRA